VQNELKDEVLKWAILGSLLRWLM